MSWEERMDAFWRKVEARHTVLTRFDSYHCDGIHHPYRMINETPLAWFWLGYCDCITVVQDLE